MGFGGAERLRGNIAVSIENEQAGKLYDALLSLPEGKVLSSPPKWLFFASFFSPEKKEGFPVLPVPPFLFCHGKPNVIIDGGIMRKIRTIGRISDIIRQELPADRYEISLDEPLPEGALVRSASMHEMEVPETLLCVARAGAGVNNIPVSDYTKRGIAVFNTPGANANAVAELVVLGMLMSGRRVIDGIEWVRSLKGQEGIPALVEKGKAQFVGPELHGKTLGVVGLGAIGVLVANAAATGLGMQVIGMDPYVTVPNALALTRSVKRAETMEELLSKSDFISIHVPLTDKTKGMIDEKRFSQMKPGAHLLNFSRAELVDADALRRALESQIVSTYITDFPTEALLEMKGVVCIPHLGASTPESEENCAVMAAASIRNYLEFGTIFNSVNLPDISLGAPEGVRVLVIHENAPGLVAKISGIISSKNINIVNMVNKSRGDVAVTVLELSEKPEEEMLQRIREQAARVRLIGV